MQIVCSFMTNKGIARAVDQSLDLTFAQQPEGRQPFGYQASPCSTCPGFGRLVRYVRRGPGSPAPNQWPGESVAQTYHGDYHRFSQFGVVYHRYMTR